jgi:hypothetical protein
MFEQFKLVRTRRICLHFWSRVATRVFRVEKANLGPVYFIALRVYRLCMYSVQDSLVTTPNFTVSGYPEYLKIVMIRQNKTKIVKGIKFVGKHCS